MAKPKLEWPLTVVIVLVLLCALSTIVRDAVFEFLLPKGKTWHDLLSAVGTFAAVIVALWIGLDTRRRAENERMQLAQLVASEISARLAELLARVTSLHTLLACTDEKEELRKNLKIVHLELSRNRLLFRRDTLEALVPLPRQTAHRIARAMDYLRLLQDRLHKRLTTIERGSDGMVGSMHENAVAVLSDVHYELEIASEECQKAAELAAPRIIPQWALEGEEEEFEEKKGKAHTRAGF